VSIQGGKYNGDNKSFTMTSLKINGNAESNCVLGGRGGSEVRQRAERVGGKKKFCPGPFKLRRSVGRWRLAWVSMKLIRYPASIHIFAGITVRLACRQFAKRSGPLIW
jgi:hypothetical protein